LNRILSNNRLLFSAYLLLLLCVTIFLIYWGKKDAHLILSTVHGTLTDELMKIFTMFGDGLFMVLVGFFLLFKRIRYGLIILSSFLASSLLVQILKRFVFTDFKRPVAWFHDLGIELYKVPGVEYHSIYSFPSGHTTTAFALFFGLSFMIKRDSLKLLCLILAILTGFSRIYLSQHFLGDALAGSLIGVITAVIMQHYFENAKALWMDKSLSSFFKRKNARV